MTSHELKEILLQLEAKLPGTELAYNRETIPQFLVSFTGKAANTIMKRGRYEHNRIIINEMNLTDAGIIATGIHQFAHHIHHRCLPNAPDNVESHNLVFGVIYDALMNDAYRKELYTPDWNAPQHGTRLRQMQSSIDAALKRIKVMHRELHEEMRKVNDFCAALDVNPVEFYERQLDIPYDQVKIIKAFYRTAEEHEDLPFYQTIAIARADASREDYVRRGAMADMFKRGLSFREIRFTYNDSIQKECGMDRVEWLKFKYNQKLKRREELSGQLSLFSEIINREESGGYSRDDADDEIIEDEAV